MPTTNLTAFLNDRQKRGVLITTLYTAHWKCNEEDVSKIKFDDFDFLVSSISLPSIRAITDQIYFDMIPVEIYKSYQYDMDFSMTVWADSSGETYSKFLQLVKGKGALDKGDVIEESGQPDADYTGNFNFKDILESPYSIEIEVFPSKTETGKETYSTVVPNGDGDKGSKIHLYSVKIKTVGNLDFSSSNPDIATFSVNASAMDFSIEKLQK